MVRIAFDSSFLIGVVEHPTTWYEDIVGLVGKFEGVMLDCVVGELQRMTTKGTKKGRYASLALFLSEGFPRARSGSKLVDDELLHYAQAKGGWVATVDRELLLKLKKARVKAITLRGGRVAIA